MAGGNISPKLGPLFAQAGAKFHIPPQVLAGVASVETGLGSDRSTSSTGAQGLMQFEPGTARSLGINPYNDRQAVFGAAKLLTQMGYHQNPLRALGAYNGGPGNPQYGYARLVMSEANRLKGQAARYVGASSPSMPGAQPARGVRGVRGGGGSVSFTPGAFKQVTTQGFDQPAYDQAVASNIAGNYVAGSNDPYKIPGPKTGLEGLAASNPALTSGGLTTGPTPNPQDYMTAQTELQKIAGKTITLNQHPTAFHAGVQFANANMPSGGGKYTNPLPGATWERTDMGVDASLPNGAPIRALGDSKVVHIYPNWYKGQPYILFQLLNGPKAGKYYYVAEAINPHVRPGQTVRAGSVIGTYNSGGTGLELGWGTSGSNTLAQATSGYSEGQQTPAGKNFRNFLDGIGARA